MRSSELARSEDDAVKSRRASLSSDDLWLVGATAAGLALYVALFLATVRDGFVRAPFGDAYDFLTVEFQAQDRHDPGLYLWAPHNGHHLVWIRLLTALDVRLFHGRSMIFVVTALLALLSAAGLIGREIWRGVADRKLGLALAAAAPLALLTTLNAIDVSVPINTVYVLSLTFAVAALILYENSSGGGLGPILGVLALVAAAGMGNSIGLAAVPVLMAAAWRRPDRAHLPLLWAAGPALVALFLVGAGSMSVQAAALPPRTPVEHGLRMAQYFVGFCGLPWSAASSKMVLPGGLQALSHAFGTVAGLLLIALGVFLLAGRARGGAARSRLERICWDLILFSLAAAGMAALGRAEASPSLMVPVRYGLLMAPLHIGVLVALVIGCPAASRWSAGALSAVLALVMVLAVGHQLIGRFVILRYTAKLEQELDAFNAGRRSPEMTDYVYPSLVHAEQVTAEMKRRGLYR